MAKSCHRRAAELRVAGANEALTAAAGHAPARTAVSAQVDVTEPGPWCPEDSTGLCCGKAEDSWQGR